MSWRDVLLWALGTGAMMAILTGVSMLAAKFDEWLGVRWH